MAKQLIIQVEDAVRSKTLGAKTTVYRVKYVSVSNLGDAVQALVPGVIVMPAPAAYFDLQNANPTVGGSTTSTVSSPGGGSGGGSSGASAGSSGGAAGSGATQGADVAGFSNWKSVPEDDKWHGIVITGEDADVQKALDVAAQLDVKSPQIKIDAKITSIDTTAAKQLGVSWTWGQFSILENYLSSNNSSSSSGSSSGTGSVGPTSWTQPVATTRQFITLPVSAAATVDAMVNNGDITVLASPSLTCMEGHPGDFFVGDDITYVVSMTQATTGQNLQTSTASVGVQLYAVGTVDPDGYITLNLHPEVGHAGAGERVGRCRFNSYRYFTPVHRQRSADQGRPDGRYRWSDPGYGNQEHDEGSVIRATSRFSEICSSRSAPPRTEQRWLCSLPLPS